MKTVKKFSRVTSQFVMVMTITISLSGIQSVVAEAATLTFLSVLESSLGNAKGHGVTLPLGLKLACTKSGSCNGATKWLLRKHEEIDRMCILAKDLGDKKPLLAQLEEIQAQAAFLNLDAVAIEYTELCGGIWDSSISYIEIQPSELVLEVEERVQLEAIIHCPPPHYLCTGDLNWKSVDEQVVTVTQGFVKAVGGGKTYVLAGSPDIPLPNTKTAKITVDSPSVDIALVIQSDYSTWHHIGEEVWGCREHACIGWPNIERDRESFRGLCGPDGDELPGRFQVEDPGVVGIALDKEGPFAGGPLTITFTCKNGIARTDYLRFRAISEGVTKIGYCIGSDTCDPLLPHRFGHWQKEFTVGTAWVDPIDPPGLRQIGNEVAAELAVRFEDYRFAATAFGAHPGYAVPCSVEDWYFPEITFWDLAPYRDFLDFTDNPFAIAEGLGQIKPICDDPLDVPGRSDGKSVYSAMMHAIQDYTWREDAFRVLIAFSVYPACWEWGDTPPYCDTEKVSGYTSNDVITAANEAGITLIMMNSGWGSYYDRMQWPFLNMAEKTDGWYTEDWSDFWPMLRAFESAFEWIYLERYASEEGESD